jgi:hypothetical protein
MKDPSSEVIPDFGRLKRGVGKVAPIAPKFPDIVLGTPNS